MNELRVIGIGSPFRNDDVGWRVIEHLQRRRDMPRHVDLVTTDRPGISLLHLLQRARRIILVDALLEADRHGEILVLDQNEIRIPETMYSSHDIGVAGSLQLAARLDMLPEQLSIVALAIDPEFTQVVDDALIEQIADVVHSELTGKPAEFKHCYS